MNTHRDSASVNTSKSSTKHRKTGEFVARESLFTELFRISHINCVRNGFIAGFILMVLRHLVDDLLHYGRLNWTFELLFLAFGQLHIVIIIWSIMTLCTTFIVYYGTYIWANNRKFSGTSLKLYDMFWLLIYICYIMGLLIIPCWQVNKYQLPFACATTVILEQLRQLMKTHSFVRENAGKIISQPNKSTDPLLSSEFSHFNQYLYFLYAPTLVFRDVYPRTSTIRWNVVFKMFGQYLTCGFLVYHILAYSWMPVFARCFTETDLTLKSAITSIFDLMLPGVLIIILCYYGFFYCWLIGFAELLRFADRMFHEDWWNSASSVTFWRTWNIIVHDWLYAYVYEDLSKLCSGKKTLPTICVTILSAILHEYWLTIVSGIFYPVLFVWYGLFGMLLRFAFPRSKGPLWSLFFLFMIPVYFATIAYLYALEMSIRQFSWNRQTFGNVMAKNGNESKVDL
ncbi:unnamed protein product [Adineta steineri]|uniref:O-acyltransferase n=2 Tax=Adineta steineri TaxID=433720 RepID=A0A815FI07_9BILA|nr:unnamed protein product [Adineta steineri]CAF3666098.1 unnamed protein product [Adineta steineri]CAF3690572.1 unnamed protein product [Adineta steineri]